MMASGGEFFLGVDGGNTKTIALLATGDGKILGAGRGGCADIYAPSSPEEARASIDTAVSAALADAGVQKDQVRAAVFSLAGADWPEDFALWTESVRGYAHRVRVVNDAIGAIIAGAPEGWGASCVCGTGGTSGALSPDGKSWHGGFLHDSSCGANNLGQAAIAAVLKADLGLGPTTSMTNLLLAHFEQASVEAMIHALTRREKPVARRAPALARLVLDAAASGDPPAIAILETQAASSASYVMLAAKKAGIFDRPFPLVLAGGVFRHPSDLPAQTLLRELQKCTSNARPVRSTMEPVAGALLAAIQLAGEAVTETTRQRLQATHPPAKFFQT